MSQKKILFQGTLVDGADPALVDRLCRELAKQVVRHRVCLVLSGPTELELAIADQVRACCERDQLAVEDHLLWCVSSQTPSADPRLKLGRRLHLDDLISYGSFARLRTYLIDLSDALLTWGGAKGVLDAIEKARLVGKPFFPIAIVGGESRQQWRMHRRDKLAFCSPEIFEDLGDQNLDPERLVGGIFAALQALWSPRKTQVFIIHGHDGGLKYELKDFLQNTMNLGVPIVLADEPSGGRTIIEKLEEYSAASNLVFCLLTPDDRIASGDDPDRVKWRSRQNAIFELGYFLGKLGRRSGRVIVLHKGPLELPSDIAGLVCIEINDGIAAAGEKIRREILSGV